MRSLFGSSASKKPGKPIVNILISEICAGSNGYVRKKTAEKTAIRTENIFLTRNRDAER